LEIQDGEFEVFKTIYTLDTAAVGHVQYLILMINYIIIIMFFKPSFLRGE